MTSSHPNVELLMKLNLRDLDASAALFSDDFVWHFFNPKLPDVQGDFVGVDGLKSFFAAMAGKTEGSFNVCRCRSHMSGTNCSSPMFETS